MKTTSRHTDEQKRRYYKHFLEMRIFDWLTDYRITHSDTVDIVAKHSGGLITVIYYGEWKKAIFVLGRRISG